MSSPYSGDLDDEEWLSWYRLSMQERWAITEQLWQFHLSSGGPLAPDRDPKSPFYFADSDDYAPSDGQPDVTDFWRKLMIRRSHEAGSK